MMPSAHSHLRPNVFLPLNLDGRPQILAVSASGMSDLDGQGRALWLGSRGIALQTELCLRFGGHLPRMNLDGSFERWINGGAFFEKRCEGFLRDLPGMAAARPKEAAHWLRQINDGGSVPAIDRLLDAIPAAERLGGAMPFGDPSSHLLDRPMPRVGDALGWDEPSEEIPVARGDESAPIIAGGLRRPASPESGLNSLHGLVGAHLFAHGRWMTLLRADPGTAQAARPSQGLIWVPMSQALAAQIRLDSQTVHAWTKDEIVQRLSRWSAPEDMDDLGAWIREATPEGFFGGDPSLSGFAHACLDAREIRASSGAATADAPRARSL